MSRAAKNAAFAHRAKVRRQLARRMRLAEIAALGEMVRLMGCYEIAPLNPSMWAGLLPSMWAGLLLNR